MRQTNFRRLYLMDGMIAWGIITIEQADKIQDMLCSDDYEMQKLGEAAIQPFRDKFFDRIESENPNLTIARYKPKT